MPLSHAYFPLTAVIFGRQLLDDGCAAELMTVGSVGSPASSGCGAPPPHQRRAGDASPPPVRWRYPN